MTATADSSIPTKVLSIDHTFFVFILHFFSFLFDICKSGNLFRKYVKMNIFLLSTVIYPKINMFRQFHLCNNLLMHIRQNTDFPQQKRQQLPSAEVNIEG